MGKSSAMSRKSAPNDRAGALSSRTGHLLIAVSFRRLFLGGLLPSRARFRFAGQMPSTAAFRAAARPVRGSKSVSHVPEHLSAMYPVRTAGAASRQNVALRRSRRKSHCSTEAAEASCRMLRTSRSMTVKVFVAATQCCAKAQNCPINPSCHAARRRSIQTERRAATVAPEIALLHRSSGSVLLDAADKPQHDNVNYFRGSAAPRDPFSRSASACTRIFRITVGSATV